MKLSVLIRVFIASPSDVQNERQEACKVIAEWNAAHLLDTREVFLEPVRMETHAALATGSHPQNLISTRLLSHCDLLVGIFWTRIGTPTETDVSGTLQEIREFEAQKDGQRVMMFFCDRGRPRSADLHELERLEQFRTQMSVKGDRGIQGLYCPYSSVQDFARKLRHQLDMKVADIINLPEFRRVQEYYERMAGKQALEAGGDI